MKKLNILIIIIFAFMILINICSFCNEYVLDDITYDIVSTESYIEKSPSWYNGGSTIERVIYRNCNWNIPYLSDEFRKKYDSKTGIFPEYNIKKVVAKKYQKGGKLIHEDGSYDLDLILENDDIIHMNFLFIKNNNNKIIDYKYKIK